ncbi:MAG: DNA internalization-related competence protein ComEC/Rec2 [Pseudomonadales bacterium]|nr:DNA internalization-related competence protein ComEC/Rec2 [Pseudomonadales bacterium]
MSAAGPLAPCAVGEHVEFLIRVQDIKQHPKHQSISALVLDSECRALVGQNVRLGSYQTEQVLMRGAELWITAKLRRPWGSINPGVPGRRLWLLGQNVRATGYIKEFKTNDLMEKKSEPSVLLHAGILRAVATGVRQNVTDDEWRLFRNTGTVHLMVVSGLHIGVLAGMVMLLLNLVVRMTPRLSRMCLIRYVMVGAAGFSVIYYCWSVGLQAPVLRAGATFAVGLIAYASLRSIPSQYLLGFAWCAVLALLPYTFLQVGFWLSFTAVAILLFTFAHRMRRATWIFSLCILQAAIFVGVTPATSFFVNATPAISPVANIVVVPLMSTIVIPLSMLGHLAATFSDNVSQPVLLVADYCLHLVMTFLEMLVTTNPIVISGIGWSGVIFSMLLAALCLIPISLRSRLIVISGWSLVLGKLPPMPEWAEFRVYTLDVGQGSAAIIDTAHHRLVFDAGPAFPSGFDAGREIVLPAMRATGSFRLDRLIVSHEDIDHSGGAGAIAEAFPHAEQISLTGCKHRDTWRWDGVTFLLLRDEASRDRNSGSCTLLIRSDTASAYLSGDIERATELALKKHIPRDIDFLAAPHHGSKTSSHPAFVKSLNPDVVVFSSGFQNRYGHPATEVVSRYRRRGAKLVWTYSSGAILWESKDKRLSTHRNHLLDTYLPIKRHVKY